MTANTAGGPGNLRCDKQRNFFCRGEWVGIINSDDFYTQDAVRLVVEASRTDKEAQLFYGNQKLLKSRESKDLQDCRECRGRAAEYMPYHPTCFVSREIYADLKFNINFRYAADWSFMLTLYLNNVKFGYINEPLACFRPGGFSSSLAARNEIYRIKAFYKMLSLPLLPAPT
ncbi:MAG: hypothetical protein ABII89_06100 [Candidatus Omnitrophota bacterium]